MAAAISVAISSMVLGSGKFICGDSKPQSRMDGNFAPVTPELGEFVPKTGMEQAKKRPHRWMRPFSVLF
jgi:hypothetical protein